MTMDYNSSSQAFRRLVEIGLASRVQAMIRRRGLRSQVSKRSVAIGQHKTSISLEAGFWDGLKEAAAHEGISVPVLITLIDTDRDHANLSSAVRLYVLDYYRRLGELALATGGAKGKRST